MIPKWLLPELTDEKGRPGAAYIGAGSLGALVALLGREVFDGELESLAIAAAPASALFIADRWRAFVIDATKKADERDRRAAEHREQELVETFNKSRAKAIQQLNVIIADPAATEGEREQAQRKKVRALNQSADALLQPPGDTAPPQHASGGDS